MMIDVPPGIQIWHKECIKMEEATKMSGLIVPNPAMSSAEKMIPVQI